MEQAYLLIQTCAAVIACVVAVIACVLSCRASKDQERLSRRQLEIAARSEARDERRYARRIDAEATAFLQRNQAERELIPLCAVAFSYNRSKAYRRSVYRDFCTLPEDVRDRVFEREGLDVSLPDSEGDDFFYEALDRVGSLVGDDDKDVFYDNGKYLRRAIERHGSEPLPRGCRECRKDRSALSARIVGDHPMEPYEDLITEVFSGRVPEVDHPVEYLAEQYGFGTADESQVCLFVVYIAGDLAILKGEKPADGNYGCLEDFFSREQIYMEDLFLWSLYTIFTHVGHKEKDS